MKASEQARRRSYKRKRNRRRPAVIIALVIALIAAVVCILFLVKEDSKLENISGGKIEPGDDGWGNRLIYNGRNYRRNENLHTLLFFGIDQNSEDFELEENENEVGTIGTGGRSDVIILFILDDSTQTSRMLTVSRDTMTEVDVYDMKGNYVSSGISHINMQYAYGDSPSKSLFLSKRTTAELLYGIRIDGAMSLTMDGIRQIVDTLGGIRLTMPQDYSYIDPQYTDGATVTLNGEEMERFIRYRDTTVTGSNEERASRQTWLIQAVFQELKRTGDMQFLEKIIDSDPDYLESDADGELLKMLSKYTIEEEKYKVPGQVTEGEMHDEFYVDEEALKALIVDLLYVPEE